MSKHLFFILSTLLCIQFAFAEGGKNLTPANTGTSTGVNQFIGYLQNGDANNSLSFLSAPGETDYNADHILRIKVKSGETVYWGLQRINALGNQNANATVRIQLRRLDNNTVVQTTNLASTSGVALDPAAGVIADYSNMVAGPSAVVGAAGYNAISYTVPAGITGGIDLAFEVLDDINGANFSTSRDRDWYHLWDITVYNGATEKPGRLHSKYWSFTGVEFVNKLSSEFEMYTAVPDGTTGNYYIKSIDLSGMQPYGFFFVSNSRCSNTDPAGNPTTNYFEQRKSKPASSGNVGRTAIPEFFNFVNNPDIEFWPTALFRLPAITQQGKCHPTRANGGLSEISITVQDPVVAIIMLNLNGIAGYQPGTRDVLIEREITAVGVTTVITWDGLDGLGNNVPSGTVVETFVRLGSFPIHYPLFDVENNSDGFAFFEHRPNPPNTPAVAFWDDDAIVAGSREQFGVTSSGAVHPWGGTGAAGTILASDIGNNVLFNTWMFGQLRQFQFFVFHVYDCTSKPPIASDFINEPLLQTASATRLPALIAVDLDGTIADYTITSVPAATEGIVNYCSNGTQPCTGTTTTITGTNTLLSPAQMATLRFNPRLPFTGQAQFTFTARDNSGLISNQAVYKLPVMANHPVSDNIVHDVVVNNNGLASLQQLSAGDADGSITNYTITSLPAPAAGVLRVNGVAATVNQVLLPAQIGQLQFMPSAGYIGTAVFNYFATDNSGNNSNTSTYTIPIAAGSRINLPPLANNIISQTLNSNDAAMSIPTLLANDKNGGIATYTILTIPTAAQGQLLLAGVAVSAGQTIAANQAGLLRFDPNASFIGKATFTYRATDFDNENSNIATYVIPVVNHVPLASAVAISVNYNSGAVKIPSISGKDIDGTIASFTINTFPTAAQGVLMYCPTAPAACLPAAMVAITAAGTSLTNAQAASLTFDVTNGYTGNIDFTYSVIDGNGLVSQPASYSITVNKAKPLTSPVKTPTMPNTNGATSILPLVGSDTDGSISSFTIHTIPDPALQGTLYVSGVAATPGQTITPAQASSLTFDPLPSFTGNALVNYSARDNDNLISNLSQNIFPVSGSGNIVPNCFQLQNVEMNSNDGSTLLSPSITSIDGNGVVVVYVITTLPTPAEGILYLGANPVPQFQLVPPNLIGQLRFDPAPNFTGQASFTYLAVDNNSSQSANGQYVIPVTNTAPNAEAFNAPAVASVSGAAPIPAFAAADIDGTISRYVIATIPPTTLGQVLVNGSAVTTVPFNVTPAQIGQLQFDPAAGFNGSVLFNFCAVDNNGNYSFVTPYTINVTEQQPVTLNVVAPKILSIMGPTAIPSLVSSDADGSVANYKIINVLPAAQGVLLLNGVAVTAGQLLTPAQAGQLSFDPNEYFIGDALFNYAAIDNVNNISNAATYAIPIVIARILPVNELQFTGQVVKNSIQLNWLNRNESDVDSYVVEKSVDGIAFKSIRNLRVGSITLNNYYLTDDNLSGGKYFYRLKLNERNGGTAYSKTLQFEVFAAHTTATYLNNKIRVSFAGGSNGKLNVEVFDAAGAILLRKSVAISNGINMIELPELMSAASGIYIIKLLDLERKNIIALKILK